MRLFKRNRNMYIKTVVVKRKGAYLILFTISVTVVVMYLISGLLAPYVLELAKNEVRIKGAEYINDSILKVLDDEKIDFNDIVIIDKDADGKVSSLSGNAFKMNVLKTKIADSINNKISEQGEMYISVPLFHLFGNSLLSSSSPVIKVQVLPAGSIEVDFDSRFESSGVNQTKHDIYINTNIKYTVLTPVGKISDKISTSVLVAQTVVIGNVPDSYINVQSEEGELKSDVLDLAQ